MPHFARLIVLAVVLLACPTSLVAQEQADVLFERIEATVPMRDGVKLHTLLYVPKEVKGPLPIIFIRTPYGIDGRAERDFRGYLKEMVGGRLRLRLPGHPRPVQVRRDVRDDAAAARPARPEERSTKPPTPTTPSTGC